MKALIAVLLLFVAACSGSDEALSDPLVVSGPNVVGSHLVWVHHTDRRVVWANPADATTDAIALSRSVRAAAFGDDRVIVLGGGAAPGVDVVRVPTGERTSIALPGVYDRVLISPRGRFAVALHDSRVAKDAPVVVANHNEIAVVDLDAGSSRRVSLETESTSPRDVVFSSDEALAAVVLDAAVVVVRLDGPGRVMVPLKLPRGTRLSPEQAVFASDGSYLFLRASGTADVLALELRSEEDRLDGSLNFLSVPGATRLLDLAVREDEPDRVLAVFARAEGSIAARIAANGDTSATRTVALDGAARRIDVLEDATVLVHGSPNQLGAVGSDFVAGWDLANDRVEQDALAGPTTGPAVVGSRGAFFVHSAEGGASTALTALALRRDALRLGVSLRPLVVGGAVRDYGVAPDGEQIVLAVDLPRADSGAAPGADTTGAIAVVDPTSLAVTAIVLDDAVVDVGVVGDYFYAVHESVFGDVTVVPRATLERSAARRIDGALLTGILNREEPQP